MGWKDCFKERKELVLATASKDGKPHANIALSVGFADGKLLIADCQMGRTTKNLKVNPNICIVGGYFRLKGTAELHSSGKYFDICVKKVKKYKVKNAIAVTVAEVFDLDKTKRII